MRRSGGGSAGTRGRPLTRGATIRIARCLGKERHMSRTRRSVSLIRNAGLVVLVAVSMLPLIATGASAVSGTVVSLTFDNGNISQYNLGYLQALQPHGAHPTFFVNSGTTRSGG